jgi:hypothetical protein
MNDAVPEGLPVQRGLWWRMHHVDAPLSAGQASSRPIGAPALWVVPVGGLRGYSAFASPHQLCDYLHEREWVGADEVDWDGRTVLAFHGKEVGRGFDGEPLVIPHPGQACCACTVHAEMPWDEFRARLDYTQLPASPWDAALGRHCAPFYWRDRHRRRHVTQVGRQSRAGFPWPGALRDVEAGE